MKDIKASVIIPAYNTEEYIGDMLDCVINQTYKNIEIIIINDGSTDNTEKIIMEYKKRDNRIVLLSIENGGVSNARNLGIKIATGEKIFFWDSDDVIELDTIESCISFAESKKVNSVLYGYSDRVNGINCIPHKSHLREVYVDNEIRNELIPCFIGHSFDDINKWIKGEFGLREYKEHTALWRIMLDSDVIKSNSLKFDTRLSLGEDTKFINEYFLYESKVGYLDQCLYHLTMRTTGANITSNSNIELMMANKLKLIDARKELEKIAIDKDINLREFWEGTMVFSAIQLIIECGKKRGRKYSEIKKYFENTDVKMAISKFRPSCRIKGIPFIMIKLGLSSVLFWIMKRIPNSVLRKIIG